MPRAIVNTEDTTRYDLKSLPEGYVVLRRLTYGQYLQRREMAARMQFSGKPGSQDVQGELAAASRKVVEFEFSNCIVEHNLEDNDGKTLDFKQPWAVHAIDPRVGEEIGSRIDEMNQFETELGNSSNGSGA
jgi:hypothetical protein